MPESTPVFFDLLADTRFLPLPCLNCQSQPTTCQPGTWKMGLTETLHRIRHVEAALMYPIYVFSLVHYNSLQMHQNQPYWGLFHTSHSLGRFICHMHMLSTVVICSPRHMYIRFFLSLKWIDIFKPNIFPKTLIKGFGEITFLS